MTRRTRHAHARATVLKPMSAKATRKPHSKTGRPRTGRPAGVAHPAARSGLPPPARVSGIQRARMLNAMAQACAELGAPNVTVAHVVERSGVSRRTFYEQFTDREDCFLTTLEEALQQAGTRVLAAYSSDEGRWRERIRTALIALLCFLEEEPHMGRLLIVETLGNGQRALRHRQKALSRVLAAIDQGRQEATAGAPACPSPLTAEATVGGVLSVLHSRLLDTQPTALLGLTGQLMSMIVLPYLGPAAAQRELQRPIPQQPSKHRPAPANPLHDLGMRLTYRTVRVLLSLATHPGSSNRQLAIAAEITDQGQISKLLTRLENLGLIQNTGAGHARGAPNAWTLTERGAEMQRTIAQQATAATAVC